MGFRFRKSAQLFPGVRLNFSRSGVSTTIGVRGAGLTIGPRGTYANLGLPGTGLSYRARLDRPGPPRRRPHAADPGAPRWPGSTPPERSFPGDEPPPSNAIWGREERIGSAPIEFLTSPGLEALRRLVHEVAKRRRDLERDITRRRAEISRLGILESVCRWFLIRLLTFPFARRAGRARIAAEARREELEEELRAARFELDFGLDDVVVREFGRLTRAFQSVERSARVWDVTTRAAVLDQVRARTIARQSINRESVRLDLGQAPFIDGRWHALRFGNANGEDLYLYPAFVMVHDRGGTFALIEIGELALESYSVHYNEEEDVPADARVVGHTWHKANKDNTPDRRFRDNWKIPVALYGWLEFRSSGLREAYMVSNAEAATKFASAFESYRRTLAAFAARGGVADDRSAAPSKNTAIEDAALPRRPGTIWGAPRRLGLGFPITDLVAAALLVWVAIGSLPRDAGSLPWLAALIAPSEQAEPTPPPLTAPPAAPPTARPPASPAAPPGAPTVTPPVASPSMIVPFGSTEADKATPRAMDQPAMPKPWSVVRVTADVANLRAGPGKNHAVVGQTRRGDFLQLLERQGQWLHVSQGALDAWLYANLAREVEALGLRKANEPKILPIPADVTREPAPTAAPLTPPKRASPPPTISDASIRQAIVEASIASYPGKCPCPYNLDRAGRRCGGRSASSRPGGSSPYCYLSDVPDSAVAAYRQALATR